MGSTALQSGDMLPLIRSIHPGRGGWTALWFILPDRLFCQRVCPGELLSSDGINLLCPHPTQTAAQSNPITQPMRKAFYY
ncbi:hypothetical protein CLV84_1939 [Neolewinella xylanilytica]|uniref:Uncharacterized protein n=1 Tax=Neolewinella xylanilytica TaxID=1514080 RepID=A0A2S6I1M1_9BACT|nr:hypothetical protein CLV84_1939 [Neolewinella xylanilytica]